MPNELISCVVLRPGPTGGPLSLIGLPIVSPLRTQMSSDPLFPRALISDEAISSAVEQSCSQFGVESLKLLQRLALCQLVRGDDVLACFPTGYGKSLIFHMLPSVCSALRASGCSFFPANPIVVVAAPLLSLMRDQVASLTQRGVSAAMIGASKPSDAEIRAGGVSIVFGSPEVLIGNSSCDRGVL